MRVARYDDTTPYYFHNDHLGRPVALTDAAGAIAWQVDYLPFGKVYTVVNNSTDNELGFPGQILDEESGFFYNYFRDYDPTTGRYVQADKLDIMGTTNDPQLAMLGFGGNGWFMFDGEIYYDNESNSPSMELNHLYGYANQNSLSMVDSFGLHAINPSSQRRLSSSRNSLPNGNMRSGFEPQDNRCSSIAYPCNIFPDTKRRCIRHDKCYDKHKCNASSWWSTSGASSKPCHQCNKDFFK
jgi:RHS repeat-associated protein